VTFYVFDFDGVLFDTARECLETAFATARERPGSRWRDCDVPPPDVAERFLANRHWVGPPWQYAVLLDCLATGEMPATTAEFVALAKRREAELASFTDDYFATRTRLSSDVARWCSVIAPYRGVVEAFRRLHDAGKAAILSTRDPASIQRIFTHFADFVPEQLARAGPREKHEALVELADHRGMTPKRLFFLDDYAHHAVPAHRRGVAAHLALWGYLGPDDIHNAREAGLPCVALADLERALARHEETT
jgi:phosphoglycolate phosphatase-like HAD superfamily hydrolase